jgi:uncharacterized protein YidB (DUF937 family)
MGFFDDVLGKIGGQQGEEGGLSSVTRMLRDNGGLQGVMGKLTGSGLGRQVQSWVGDGQNQPISGSQVKDALDDDSLNKMAQQAGTTPDKVSDEVAKILPDMVDKATPQGQVPQQGQDPLSKGSDAIKNMFARH